ncbi:MAG: 50S ribosomal protein L23 [Gemmatimonadetes bacterium]|nr:50S ribosomal protein L23 [Gemmatimonadota bacterium]
MRDPREVIIRPVVTERSTELGDALGAYTFVVAKAANKIEIRRAVEQLFNVKVAGVRTMNVRGKWRRVGRSLGRRPAYKKAIVTLAEGEKIDVYEGI